MCFLPSVSNDSEQYNVATTLYCVSVTSGTNMRDLIYVKGNHIHVHYSNPVMDIISVRVRSVTIFC